MMRMMMMMHSFRLRLGPCQQQQQQQQQRSIRSRLLLSVSSPLLVALHLLLLLVVVVVVVVVVDVPAFLPVPFVGGGGGGGGVSAFQHATSTSTGSTHSYCASSSSPTPTETSIHRSTTHHQHRHRHRRRRSSSARAAATRPAQAGCSTSSRAAFSRRRRIKRWSSKISPSSSSSSSPLFVLHSSSSSSSEDEDDDADGDDDDAGGKEKHDLDPGSIRLEYDMVVIGAGASGMFGAGAATSLGAKTLLIDRAAVAVDSTGDNDEEVTTNSSNSSTSNNNNNIGGDCTNAACVPSKAVRSVARMAASSASSSGAVSSSFSSCSPSSSWLHLARHHATTTVSKVRNREDPNEMVKRSNHKLDIMICHSHNNNTPPADSDDRGGSGDGGGGSVRFISPHELQLNAKGDGRGYVEQYLCDDDRSNDGDDNDGRDNITLPSSISIMTSTVNRTRSPIFIKSKKFLIATGSGPKPEPKIEQTARQVGIPVYNYRTILRGTTTTDNSNNSNKNTGIWGIVDDGEHRDGEKDGKTEDYTSDDDDLTLDTSSLSTKRSSTGNSSNTKKTIVIAGGGATALELGQSLARLCNCGTTTTTTTDTDDNVDPKVRIYIVAPQLLKGEDSTLQQAAYDLLASERGIDLAYLGYRVDKCCCFCSRVETSKSVELVKSPMGNDASNATSTTTKTIPDVDAIVLATGRQPGPDLASLQLDNAQVEWNETHGVFVKSRTLQSTTQPHIYACGDCAFATVDGGDATTKDTSRTATHAAWTGYHAVSNALLPKWLTFGSKSIHDVVPRVIYTDPELVSVGMSEQECTKKYGKGGFQQLHVSENGTDRSDIDSLERPMTNSAGFVELRATLVDGRVLGFTGCGPSASELANQMSVVIANKLTVRQIAKSLHSFPSYGYLLHRVALSMALQDIWGSLEACGPIGSFIAKPGRIVTKCVLWFRQVYKKLVSFLFPSRMKPTVRPNN